MYDCDVIRKATGWYAIMIYTSNIIESYIQSHCCRVLHRTISAMVQLHKLGKCLSKQIVKWLLKQIVKYSILANSSNRLKRAIVR